MASVNQELTSHAGVHISKFIFLVECDGVTVPIIVTAPDLKLACQKLHGHLRARPDGTRWSANWRDLLDDIEDSNLEVFGPFDTITEL